MMTVYPVKICVRGDNFDKNLLLLVCDGEEKLIPVRIATYGLGVIIGVNVFDGVGVVTVGEAVKVCVSVGK